jgi:VWFA-related protein
VAVTMRRMSASCVARVAIVLVAIGLCDRTGHGAQQPQQQQSRQPSPQSSQPPSSQQPPPPQPTATFRATTPLVVQVVTVKDKDGRAIEGLTAKDFVVTEDGQPQTISFVEFQRLKDENEVAQPDLASASRPAATAAPPPILAADPGAVRHRDRRLLVLFFDLTAMPPQDLSRAYAAALSFIDRQMTAADLLAVMTFDGGSVRMRQDFSGDRARLKDVIDGMMVGDDRDGDGVRDLPDVGTAFGQDDAEFNILNTDRQLSALQTAASMLRAVPEQKSLVYFASGLRLNGVDNQAQLRATTNAAIRSNVAIFPVDARGLVAQAPLGDATRASPGGIGVLSGRLTDAATNSLQRSQDTLFSLARDTGGKAMFDNNDLALGIVQAARAVTSYYLVGFYTTHTARDGRFHRVKVSLVGDRAATLSSRQGYFADKEFARFTAADKERQLEDALMLDNPVTEIAIAMEVNYFQLNRAEYFVPVAVKIPGSELMLARRRGAPRTVIDFIGEVKDELGVTMQNVRDKLDIKLSEETAEQLSTRPIQYETGFTLLPGKYAIKFLARDAETGRIGTFQTTFTVPNLNREERRVPISSVVLSSQRVPLANAIFSVQKKGAATESADPLVFDGQKLVPSVTRVFSRSRDLYVFLQAYEGAAAIRPLVAFVAFYRGDVKAFETTPMPVSADLDARSKAVPLRFQMPLERLAAGRYDCQVTVLSLAGQKAAFWRAPVVIVP